MLLAVPLLMRGAPVDAESPAPSTAAALGPLVPAHHPLQAFDGPVTWYAHRPPPEVRYVQPDFEAWAATLEEAKVDPATGPFVAIWRDAAGAIRHVLANGDRVRLFSLDGDAVEFEDPGFLTQVGVARWGWVYKEGLLRTHRTWRMALGPIDDNGLPAGPPSPTALFAVTDYEYRKGHKVPTRSRTFWSEQDRQAGRWGQKTSYGPDGSHKKTRHNPERPYPH